MKLLAKMSCELNQDLRAKIQEPRTKTQRETLNIEYREIEPLGELA